MERFSIFIEQKEDKYPGQPDNPKKYQGKAFWPDPEKGYWMIPREGKYWWFSTWEETRDAIHEITRKAIAKASGYNPNR